MGRPRAEDLNNNVAETSIPRYKTEKSAAILTPLVHISAEFQSQTYMATSVCPWLAETMFNHRSVVAFNPTAWACGMTAKELIGTDEDLTRTTDHVDGSD